MLGGYVRERLTLKDAFRYGSWKLVIAPSFCSKVLLQCVLTENWQFRSILLPFSARLGSLQGRDCKRRLRME